MHYHITFYEAQMLKHVDFFHVSCRETPCKTKCSNWIMVICNKLVLSRSSWRKSPWQYWNNSYSNLNQDSCKVAVWSGWPSFCHSLWIYFAAISQSKNDITKIASKFAFGFFFCHGYIIYKTKTSDGSNDREIKKDASLCQLHIRNFTT